MSNQLKNHILTDIGGTYVRFARDIEGEPQNIQKYAAADFQGLSEALSRYCNEQGIEPCGELSIAGAGAPDNENASLWRITNNKAFDIDLSQLKEQGWNIVQTLNDFEAATYALPILSNDDLKTLHQGRSNNRDLCLLGPGTGLGLGYLRNRKYVQKTHGGHMPIASLNDEHGKIIKELRENHNRALVFEDIVSGPGLQNLRTKYDEEKALRLFHEFLGIFAANAVITGNSYGGIYLTGGVIASLYEKGRFNFETFRNALCFDAVPCVKEDIENTSIHIVTDPYPAFKGLIHAKSLPDN